MAFSPGALWVQPRKLIEPALLVLLVFIVGKPLLGLLSRTSEVSIPPTVQSGVPETYVKPDFSILGSFDAFHRLEHTKSATHAEPAQSNAPETDLDLKVFGMRADFSGDSSSAIIQTPDRKQATYYIGDEIIPGVTLKQVDVDYILLDRNGQVERLSRQGKEESGKSGSYLPGSLASVIPQGTLSYKAIELVNGVRFFPAREGREIIGYRVISRRGSTLSKFGFKQNDIIVSINGESLAQNRVNLPAILKNLKQARYASFQVIRNDVPMSLEVNLQ